MNKKEFVCQKSNLLFAAPIMLIAFYLISTDSRYASVHSNESEPLQSLLVLVKDQPDTPLKVINIKDTSTSLYMPDINLVVQNTSLKSIRAYAIRYDIGSGKINFNGLELSIGAGSKADLQPDKSEIIEVGAGANYSSPIDSITIAIDFVEFEDGTTWGLDIGKTRERLDGMRAGSHAAIGLLVKLTKTDGIPAVISIIETASIDITPPANRSPEWLNGFHQGIGLIQGRLKNTYADKGIAEMERALQQPFNVPEWRWLK
jgi:hypothetical protein